MTPVAASLMSRTAAAVRLALFVAWTLLVIPPYGLTLVARWRGYRRFARLYWRGAARILGMRVIVRGEPSPTHPTLFVANHASYLDIVVLGSLIEAAFVAKKEVGGWPGIGVIAKLGRTIFVDRRPARAGEQRDEITKRLDKRESLILFAEGTSNDGNRVLPFKSALFSAAEGQVDGRPVTVQPISLAYTRLDGLPIGHGWRPFFAWYGDMTLAPHLWTVLGLGRVTAEVTYHAPTTIEAFRSRKALADHCHALVARGVAEALSGRTAQAA